MIRRLAIRGLVVIDEAEIEPADGLTAITGETGAGKTVLAQAVSLLVGAPADSRVVRPGAPHAFVEATLELPESLSGDDDSEEWLSEIREMLDDPSEAVVAVRLPATGRTRALIDGQTTTRKNAAELARRAIRFSSQHEGRTLVESATQRALLDAFAGPRCQEVARALAAQRRALRRIDREIAEAIERRGRAERERAELEELIADVDAAGISVDEEAQLRTERDRLRHSDRLIRAAAGAADALAPEVGEGAVDQIGTAQSALRSVGGIDPDLDAIEADLVALAASAQDGASRLRSYLAAGEGEPGRLDVIEDRLGVYDRLSRRHGPGIQAVIDRAEEARSLIAQTAGDSEYVTSLEADRDAALAAARDAAQELAQLRRDAIPRLESAVGQELAELGMADAVLRVAMESDDGDPPEQRITMMLRANPGLPEVPLAQTASGGELSRLLLALHSVAARAEPDATWIFDEVDAGIGGVTATAVAAKLRELSRGRQVIVITHLPQVAAAADRHYRLMKGADAQGRATTSIEALDDADLVDEICRMLGSPSDDQAARAHAQELIARRGVES